MRIQLAMRTLSPLAILWLVAGCGGRSVPAPADFDKAREVLQTALDAWQADQSSESLQRLTPPLFVNDPEWLAGARLQSYQVVGEMKYHGVQARCAVRLTLVDKSGAAKEKQVNYLVDTSPALVIVRGDP